MPAKRKPGRPKKKHAGGRPTVMTERVLDKLNQAFAIDCTDVEACLFAGISDDALYKYQRENPEYIKRKAQLKEMPVLQARTTVVTHLQEDPGSAKWYLERKKKDEFGPNQKAEVEITNIEDIINAITSSS